MSQGEIFLLDEPLIIKGENPMPTEKEEIFFEKREIRRMIIKCDACPDSTEKIYYLIVGDTKLIKLCPLCLKRLKNAIYKKHI